MSGLGEAYWREVITVLRSIIPVYDKVNNAISLGKDNTFRTTGIKKAVIKGDKILDAGSGFGNMTGIALEHTNQNVEIIMMDPILEMLRYSTKFESKSIVLRYSGIFENIPFKDNTFDVVMCGYSLRDAIKLEQAITEFHRILKNGGRFIIIDLGKPDNLIIRIGVKLYLRYILKILAYIVAGKTGLQFKTLYGTFLRWPQNKKMYQLLSNKFQKVEFIKKLKGGSIIVISTK
ncbi:MAG: class I SAM-dependent methyltransferase [Nitrososphaeraceae archaeon]